jgi:hypothetical protein
MPSRNGSFLKLLVIIELRPSKFFLKSVGVQQRCMGIENAKLNMFFPAQGLLMQVLYG